MVDQLIAICRSQGMMAIGGVHYPVDTEKDPDRWRIAKTDANVDKIGNMVFDAIHAAIACIPWGSFAFLQPLPQPEAPSSRDAALAVYAPH